MRVSRVVTATWLLITLACVFAIAGCAERADELFPELDRADRISVSHGATALRLTRDEAGWWVDLPGGRGRADDELVAHLLAVLGRSSRSELVPGGAERLEMLGLDEGSSGLVTVFAHAQTIARTRTGSQAPGASRVFIMPVGDSEVFVSPDGLADLLSLPLREWRDRSVLEFALPDVVGIELWNRDRRMTLVPLDGRWHMTEPIEQDVHKGFVDALLFALAELEAVDFADDRPIEACGFGVDEASARGRVAISLKDDRVLRLSFGSEHEKGWCAMRPDRSDVYVVPRETVEIIFGKDSPESPAR